MSDSQKPSWPKWVRDDKSLVSCTEKVKVMTENFDELKQIAQDALEDGLLMEVSEAQMREALHALVDIKTTIQHSLSPQ
jgi:nicotinate-nucleotide pyrophosphorylase